MTLSGKETVSKPERNDAEKRASGSLKRVVGLLVELLKSKVARRRLFWITLRRCPECHGALVRDWPQYDDGRFIYCMPCGGMILPPGFWPAVTRHIRTKLKQPNDQAQ